jgi:hypothetical protein
MIFDFSNLFSTFKLMLESNIKMTILSENYEEILMRDLILMIDSELLFWNNFESEIECCFIKVKFSSNNVLI